MSKAQKKRKPSQLRASEVFYILWNPASSHPPTIRLGSLSEAKALASRLATEHAPQKFFICRAEEVAEARPIQIQIAQRKLGGA